MTELIVLAVQLARDAIAAMNAGNATPEQLDITRALTQAKVDAAVAAIDDALAKGHA